MEKRTVACSTLGCKVNQYESSAVERLFKEKGYKVVDFNEKADIYVINTCTVTHAGDRKSRQLIRRASRANPEGLVVVTGCYAQTAPGEVLEIPGVDLVVGTGDRHRIIELVEDAARHNGPVNAVKDIMSVDSFEELPPALDQNRIRSFLKIQEGCDNFCTYCIVPYARGPVRSRNPESILKEAKELLARGFKEIVLTGTHTGAYGKDLDGAVNLAGLVRKMAGLKGLYRLRLSSLEPQDTDFDLIDVLSTSPVVCRHLHIPLQSGDDNVLEGMKRRYNTDRFREIVARIRKNMPGAAITTDVMVGFPGENEERFENSFNFVREMEFADMHIFKYSPRSGTPAASFTHQVSAGEKERRSKDLARLGQELKRRFISGHLGKKVAVLVEQARDDHEGLYEGLTDNYIKVAFPGEPSLRGCLVNVMAEQVKEDHLCGRII